MAKMLSSNISSGWRLNSQAKKLNLYALYLRMIWSYYIAIKPGRVTMNTPALTSFDSMKTEK